MAELMRWKLEDGGEVLVETRPDGPEISPVSRAGELIESASVSLDAALGHVSDAASVVLKQFHAMAAQPDKVEVEFGVSLTVQAGAVIAKTSIDGHLNVKLTWESNAPEPPPGAAVEP
jgi:hypothetical protein